MNIIIILAMNDNNIHHKTIGVIIHPEDFKEVASDLGIDPGYPYETMSISAVPFPSSHPFIESYKIIPSGVERRVIYKEFVAPLELCEKFNIVHPARVYVSLEDNFIPPNIFWRAV